MPYGNNRPKARPPSANGDEASFLDRCAAVIAETNCEVLQMSVQSKKSIFPKLEFQQ
jgi:hypothetical protein